MENKKKKQFGTARWMDKLYEGYDLYTVPSPKGKPKTVAVYTGYYYQADISGKKQLGYKFVYTLLTLLSVLFFGSSAIQPIEFNNLRFVGVVQMVSLVAVVYLVVTVILYWTREQRMTEYVHRITSRYLKNSSAFSAVCMAICAGSAILFAIFGKEDNPEKIFGAVCLYLCAAACMVAIYRIECALAYSCEKSDETPPPGADKCT